MKTIWTIDSASEDLKISTRHVRRYLQALGIKPSMPEHKNGWRGGQSRMIILGLADMERLREAVAKGKIESN